MKSSKLKFKIIFLAIIFCGIFGLAKSSWAAEELSVVNISRISHPAYTMSNYAWTIRSPFNVDYSRVLMWENGVYSMDPAYQRLVPSGFNIPGEIRDQGRGAIWGCIAQNCVTETAGGAGDSIDSTLQNLNLRSAAGGTQVSRKLIAWDDNTVALPTQFMSNGMQILWSPYADEKNIVYALCGYDSGICAGHHYQLAKYNVDSGSISFIASYYRSGYPDVSQSDCGSGTQYDYSKASIVGFTRDLTAIHVATVGDNCVWRGTATIFLDKANNFANPTVSWNTGVNSCSSGTATWGRSPGVHGAWSPDGTYYAEYGRTDYLMANNEYGGPCYDDANAIPYSAVTNYWQDTVGNAFGGTHLDWNVSNDWYIASNWNEGVGCSAYCTSGGKKTYPYLTNATGDTSSRIDQITINKSIAAANGGHHPENISGLFTHNILINRMSAGSWVYNQNDEGQTVNYHGLPSATMGDDGRHLYFFGTDGKYTRDDVAMCNWLANNQSYVPNYAYTKSQCDLIGNNWEGNGTYLATLSSAGSDTTPPASPAGLTVQ